MKENASLKILKGLPIGQIIRKLREKRKLKVYELAKKVEVHPVYITQLERHDKLPAPERFLRILAVLEIDFGLFIILKTVFIEHKFPRLITTLRLFQAFEKKLPHPSNRQSQKKLLSKTFTEFSLLKK